MLTLAELPDKYFCFVFSFEIDTTEISRSVGRHEFCVVDGERWRLEIMSEAEKGIVVTYDGEKLRSSSRKIDALTLDQVSDMAPTTWFPKLFKLLKKAPVLSVTKSSLEGMMCDRYSLQDETAPLEAWVHKESHFPIQIITRASDSAITIQRFIWVPKGDTGEAIVAMDMSFHLYPGYSDRINRNIKELTRK